MRDNPKTEVIALDLNETLRRQLLAYSVSSEILKKTENAKNVDEIFENLCLGFHDLAEYSRVMVLTIDKENFCLKPRTSVGFDKEQLKDFQLDLSFLSGEYADAIFLNRHILVDEVPEYDAFSLLGCKSYIVFPILKRSTENCWKAKNCGKPECVCYESKDSYCWANPKAGLAINAKTEDDKRNACINCPVFKCSGLLWLDLTGYRQITGEDSAMIFTTVTQAGFIADSITAYEELFKTNEKLELLFDELKKAHHHLELDLQQANSIQQKLLPTSFPRILTDVTAFYKSNLEVGGDYYDCFELENGNIGFVVADVSGHGTAAAMMMSMFKMLLKASPLNSVNPALMLKQINDLIIKEMDSEKFITVFYAIYFPQTGEFQYANAGHIPIPLINKRTLEIELLKASGLFIGIMPNISLENFSIHIEEPHRLLLYTDGLNEAMNLDKEEFGHNRVYQILKEGANKPSKELIGGLFSAVEKFQSVKEFSDDITIFACDL